ncbi:MAG: NAD(P)H-hydrate dehydratase [Betaproteobacteria bacterium]|nr:NAD(P)H-hydrate dehydratase [Betaproteobacteria bacterium]
MLRAEQALQARSTHALMDLAGLASARLAQAVAPHAQHIWVLAGPGNNGGDGLEAAIHLQEAGLAVRVWLPVPASQRPADAQRAWTRAQAAGIPIHEGLPPAPDALGSHDLCIDALLGTGARRPPDGALLAAIAWLRASPAPVLAIDLPSGLDADSGQALGQPEQLVRADHTLTMLAPKPGLFMGAGRDACGTLWLAPLSFEAPGACGTPDAEINPRPPIAQRLHASHKGTHGDVAIVGGESTALRGLGMRGAAWLAASAALHAGAGRTLLAWPETSAQDDTLLEDIMLRHFEALDLPKLTVVAGCGGGRSIVAQMGAVLQRSARLVLDADALNAVAADAWLQELLRARAGQGRPTILTPHPLEAARLLGCSTADVQSDRLLAAQQLAERHHATVVLKGSGTVIAQTGLTPRINPTGNGRLAIGGTGDVLAGFMAGCWASGLSPWQAACTAVWRHGHLADAWPADTPLTASALARCWP